MVLRIDKPGTVRTVPLVTAEDDPQGLYTGVALRVRMLPPDQRETYAREFQAVALLEGDARRAGEAAIVERYVREAVAGIDGVTWGDEPVPSDPSPELVWTVLRQGGLAQLAALAASAAQTPTRAEKNS